MYQFSAVLPFLLWFHSSNISQRAKPDFVLKLEYAQESNVLTDMHPGCLLLLLGPPALLITESLSSALRHLVFDNILWFREHVPSWALNEVVKPPLMMNSRFHLCFFSNFTMACTLIFLRTWLHFSFLELSSDCKKSHGYAGLFFSVSQFGWSFLAGVSHTWFTMAFYLFENVHSLNRNTVRWFNCLVPGA